MTLLDEVLAYDPHNQGPCVVAATVAAIEDKEAQEDLSQLLEMPHQRAAHSAIAVAMARRGWARADGKPLSELQIGRHRRGVCSCG